MKGGCKIDDGKAAVHLKMVYARKNWNAASVSTFTNSPTPRLVIPSS